MDDSQKKIELEQRLTLLEDELMRAQRLSSVGALASSITHEFKAAGRFAIAGQTKWMVLKASRLAIKRSAALDHGRYGHGAGVVK